MDELNTLIQDLQAAFGDSSKPVLSIYADTNPARPENAGRAWVGRIKNTLKELLEREESKPDNSLCEQVLALVEQERPSARTLVLFASRNPAGKPVLRRIDLQVELPVVDLAHGRVEARWGEPYLTPLFFAFDEYERGGVLHLSGSRWRFYELFLGELREDTEIFANISAEEWQELQELAGRIENAVAERRARSGGTFDKLSPKEREAAKVSLWMHKLYLRLASALDKAVDRLALSGWCSWAKPGRCPTLRAISTAACATASSRGWGTPPTFTHRRRKTSSTEWYPSWRPLSAEESWLCWSGFESSPALGAWMRCWTPSS
jgi:hypothetical protein